MTIRNSVVYTAAVGIGIDHAFGNMTASNITFDTIDIEGLHGNAGGQATWLAVFVEVSAGDGGAGVGPIEDVYIRNIRARAQGSRTGRLEGYSSAAMVNGVTITDVYMLANTTPATTLEEMKVLNTSYSENIRIVNS